VRIRKASALVVAAGAIAGFAGTAAPALAGSTTNPSALCTANAQANAGISHGGCASTAARFGSAELESLPYLSTSAFVSNCKGLPTLFQQMVASGGPTTYPITLPVSGVTLSSPDALANYMFHDIFGPDMSTCVAILAADHATIAHPGPDRHPYDVYYTGGHGGNTTYAPGVPPDLAPFFRP
jgi:hypothetical protein